MADNILKLRVESSEYDQKLKKAAEGIRHLAEVAHRGGGELTGLENAELDYVKSLGTMETKSRTAAGSVRELESVFKELTVVYNQLNDVEKQDEGGKALAASLDQLKQRAQAARAELDNASKALGEQKDAGQQTGGMLDGLADKFGLSISKVMGFGTALAAGKVALDVAKDAFFANESSVDEWGRTVAASQSLYEGFLTAINNGDISGYLSNIDSIVKAARLAYDELDKLGTMKTIQAPQISKQQTENERIRSMIQTGRYIAPQDGRKNAVFNGREMQNGDKLTAGQIRYLEKQLQGGMQKMVKLVGNEVDQTGKAINAYYDKLAKQNGMSLQEFKKGTSSWAEFNKRMQGYEDYKKFENEHTSVRERYNPTTQEYESYVIRDQEKNPHQQYAKWGTFRVDKEGDSSYKDLVALIQQRDQQVGQVYSTQAQAYRTMNRAEGVTVRQIMGGTGGKGGKGGTTDKNLDDEQKVQAKINDLLKEALTADAERQGEIRQQVAELQKQQEKYKDIKNLALGILPKDKEAVFTVDGQLSEETKKNLRDIENVTIDDKTMTVTADTQEAMQKVQEMIGQVSTTTLQVKAKVQPVEMSTGLSGFNEQTISAWTAMMKSDLQKADLGSALYSSLTHNMEDMSRLTQTVQSAIKLGLDVPEDTVQQIFERIFDGENMPADMYDSMIQKFIEDFKERTGKDLVVGENGGLSEGTPQQPKDERDGNRFLKKNDEGKYEAKMTDIMSGMAGGIQNVVTGLNTLGVEIPAGLQSVLGGMQAVSSILSGIAVTVMAIEAIAGADAIIPFANGGVIPTFAQGCTIHAFSQGGIIPKFADGGLIGRAAAGMMIPGNSMSGDNLRLPVDGGRGMIGVNSGELILNKSSQNSLAASLLQAESLVDSISDYRVSLGNAQQMSMASELEGGAAVAENTQPFINGEMIYLGLQAYLRRSGMGEIVTAER